MEIQISVRNLVEFILREGDIDNRHHMASDTAMQEGSRIHRMIQKRMGMEYEAEVPLRYIWDTKKYRIVIDGRADGVIHKDGQVIIDEIKGTYCDIHRMKQPQEVHLAQAKCYAYILAGEEGLKDIGVRMTYCNIESEEIRYFHENYTFQTLKKWFEELMQAYRKWADFEYEWKEKRRDSIKTLSFPFAYRKGQKELATHVYQTICHQKKLFIQAPTGVGKTISTVFPAVKAVGEDKADKIFYLTAKTITRTVAENSFAQLRENGLQYKTVTLTAKEKICMMDEMKCNPEYCPYAKGHFNRINDAIYDLLTSEDAFNRETVEQYAQKHMVCPFEMSLDMSLFSDAIICDYNYLFDPYVHLKRFFSQQCKGPYLFLVDEAHNLVERGRSMYSSELIKEDFLALKRTIAPYGTRLERYIDRCNKQLLALKKQTEGLRVLSSTGELDLELVRLHSAFGKFLEEDNDCPVRDDILEFYFQVSRYLDVNEKLDHNYVTYAQYCDNGDFMVKQFCVNPAERLQECMNQGVATILFSATFLPIQYYKQLLGGGKEDFEVYASSSFSSEQMKLIVAKDVTSKYNRRGESEYFNIASYIYEITNQKKGNYMIFCPSHAFLEEVLRSYTEFFHNPDSEQLMVQKERMTETEREAFLHCFERKNNANAQSKDDKAVAEGFAKICMSIEIEEPALDQSERKTEENRNRHDMSRALTSFDLTTGYEVSSLETIEKSILGFCVLGGIFSEGIDLRGESLIGAIVIGTGLPQICQERELLKQFFDAEDKNGFDYAYRYPGMNKVLQAAGRVIRTSSDRGVVALLDERFLQRSYQNLFPREWEHYEPVSLRDCADSVADFWDEKGLQ